MAPSRVALTFLALAACAPKPGGDGNGNTTGDDTGEQPVEALTAEVLVDGLDNVFEMVWGPDGELWVTERTTARVTRVSLDGTTSTLLDVPDVLVTDGTQDGLLGMALHPEIGDGTGHDFVYVAHSYDADPSEAVEVRNMKIVRYTYDVDSDSLVDPRDVLSGLPGSGDHNSGRLLYGPDAHLYYSIGDQGKNQYDSYCLAIEAQRLPTEAEVGVQDWSAYQGKVLRMSLDGSVPGDNPVIGGVQSHVWTFGHRNAQGLAFAADGTLYESEHGPKSDDEVNVLEAGGNYGWPHVAGFRDDQAYVYANWSASEGTPCEDLEYSDFEIPASVPVAEETEWTDLSFHAPARTFHTVADDYDFLDDACAEGELYYLCWPTIAPSSVAVYEGYAAGIQGLEGSLLITSLKLGTLYRVPLTDSEGAILPATHEADILFHSVDRFRRVTVSPDGSVIYVATDVAGNAMGDDGAPTDVLTHSGAILALSATGD